MILGSNPVDLEGSEARRNNRRPKRGAKRVQMVYFGREFPNPGHMVLDLVPNSIQWQMGRNIDIEQGAPRALNANESGREVVQRNRRPKGCEHES